MQGFVFLIDPGPLKVEVPPFFARPCNPPKALSPSCGIPGLSMPPPPKSTEPRKPSLARTGFGLRSRESWASARSQANANRKIFECPKASVALSCEPPSRNLFLNPYRLPRPRPLNPDLLNLHTHTHTHTHTHNACIVRGICRVPEMLQCNKPWCSLV